MSRPHKEIDYSLKQRLHRIAEIVPGCFLGRRCSAHEVAKDALDEIERLEADKALCVRIAEGYQQQIQELKQRLSHLNGLVESPPDSWLIAKYRERFIDDK